MRMAGDGSGVVAAKKKTTPIISKNDGTGIAGALGPLYNNFSKTKGGGTPTSSVLQRRNTGSTGGSGNTGYSGGNRSYSTGSSYTAAAAPTASAATTETVAAAPAVQSAQNDNNGNEALANMMKGYMQSYLNQMQSAISAAQQQAKEAQERAEAQLKAAQEAQRKAREEAYNRSAAQQKTDYEYGQGQLNSATDSALQQAYINHMMQQRNLAQSLAAQGLNGGTSETTTAGLYNNYNNSRNALETERASQLASLLNTYQNNMAQLENQKASGDAADLTQYQTNLANLTANNANNLISLMQGYANMASTVPQVRQKFNTSTGQWEYSYE